MLTLPISNETAVLSQETVEQLEERTFTEINGDDSQASPEEEHTNGLIGDLAWILLLGAIVTLLLKAEAARRLRIYPRRLSREP